MAIGTRPATALLAPDSFKGTFPAAAVATALAEGCEAAGIGAELCPLADGGEGTAAVLLAACGGERVPIIAHDPFGRPVEAEIVLLGNGERAVVEVAAASGFALLDPGELEPWAATTRGTGELIAAALARGAREVLVGAGGSATVDGARGAVEALRDAGGLGGGSLTVLCDTVTPWERCAEVFGPQKGAEESQLPLLATRLDDLARALPRDPRGVPMGGAAGGLAGGLWAACGARLVPGAAFVCDAVGFDRRLAAADWVITGEGRLDEQSATGKVVGEVADRAAAAGLPWHAVVGSDARGSTGEWPGLGSVIAAGTLEAVTVAAREIALTGARGTL